MSTSFKDFVSEMTLAAGDLSSYLEKMFDDLKKMKQPLDHIGDISDVNVFRSTNSKTRGYDILKRNNEPIGFSDWTVFQIKHALVFEIGNIYFIPEEQRKDLGYKYFFFLKNVLHLNVLLGNVHSKATVEFLKKQDRLRRFDLKWYNIQTGDLEDFKNSKYSLTGRPSEWRVLIESDEGHEPIFNQFRSSEITSLRNSYDWLFDGIEDL